MQIISNYVPRDILDGWELSEDERKEFDYLNFQAIEAGEDSASFFRYKGELYDLGEFTVTSIEGWDGIHNETFYSGILVKYAGEYGDYNSVIVGRYFT